MAISISTGVYEVELTRLLARGRSRRVLLGGLRLLDEVGQHTLLHLIVVVLIIGTECVAVRPRVKHLFLLAFLSLL